MRLRNLTHLLVAGFMLSVLAACGGSSSSSGCSRPGCDSMSVPLSGGGVKGPIINAAYTLSVATIVGGEVVAGAQIDSGVTGVSGIANFTVADTDVPPFLLEIDGTGGTDIGINATPAITNLKTIVTQAMLDSGQPVFATPLSTVATDIAAASSATPADLVAQLPLASAQTLTALGFGTDAGIDLFTTPPIVTDAVAGFANTQNTAAFRVANEALTAAVAATANPGGGVSNDDVLAFIADDLADGMLDEDTGMGAEPALAGIAAALAAIDENTALPGATMGETIAGVTAALVAEAGTTGQTVDPVVQNIIQTAPNLAPVDPPEAADLDISGGDLDGDGRPDATDAFPGDITAQDDVNNNGVPDNLEFDTDTDGVQDDIDNCPADINADQLDGDGDGVGAVCDFDDGDVLESVDLDADTVGDNADNCPVANTDQADLDGDLAGNLCDVDADGDGVNGDGMGGPGADVNDLSNAIATDADTDGIDDVGGGTFNPVHPAGAGSPDNCPVANTDQADLDGDLAGNLCDVDADGDGVNGDGMGGPGADVNDLSNAIATDADTDGIDDVGGGTFNPVHPAGAGSPDNCPVANTDQADLDGDLEGNLCDVDADGDGVNGDGMGGPGADVNDLSNAIATDADTDGIDDVGGGTFNPVHPAGAGSPDNCPVANADQADLDGDLEGNLCDVDADGDGTNGDGMGGPGADDNDLDAAVIADADTDGVDDVGGGLTNPTHPAGAGTPDNCPVANADQADLDADTTGNACDADADGDGVDGDGAGGPGADANDLNADLATDADGDGVDDVGGGTFNPTHPAGAGTADNCPATANADQANTLNTATPDLGDACDPDDDGVGTAPEAGMDNCPNDANGPADSENQIDTPDADGIGNICDPDDDNDTIPDADDPDPSNPISEYHFDFWSTAMEVATATAATGQFSLAALSEVILPSSGDGELTELDLTGGSGTGTFQFDGFSEFETALTAGTGCIQGTGCTLATATATALGSVANDDANESLVAVYTPGSPAQLAVDDGEFDIGTDGMGTGLDIEVDLGFGVGGTQYTAFAQSFVAVAEFAGGVYPIATGDPCATAIGLGAFTNGNDGTLQTALDTLIGGSSSAAVHADIVANCASSTSFGDTGVRVLSPAPTAAATSDLNSSSYGLIEFGVNYTTTTASDLVQLDSRVSHVAIDGSGTGAITQSAQVAVRTEIGSEEAGMTSAGQIEFGATTLGAVAGVTTSANGVLSLDRTSDTLTGILASDLELMTFNGVTTGSAANSDTINRAYAAKLGSTVASTELNGATFNLQGVAVQSGTDGVDMSTLSGLSISFTESAGNLTAVLAGTRRNLGVVFDDANDNLPMVFDTTDVVVSESASTPFTIDTEGRFSTIVFEDSGLELDGFYTANGGLLLRLADTLAATGGGGGGGGNSAEFFFGEVTAGQVFVNPATLDPIVPAPVIGTTITGFILVSGGGGGTEFTFTDLARVNPGVPQDFAAVDTAGGESFESYVVTQGVLLGTPAP